MSLINDALKRAKQAQTQTPPPAFPQPRLDPVEAKVHARPSRGLALPISLVIIVSGVLIVALGRFRERDQKMVTEPNKPIALANSIPPKQIPQPAANVTPTSPPAAPKEIPEQVVFGPPSGNTPTKTETKPLAPEPVSSNVPAEPSAAPLKLTGILFHPTHPAAMIAGKTLYLNDTIRDWRLVAINRESATLAHAGQTNVLTLPQ
jgi:hypothetical protein